MQEDNQSEKRKGRPPGSKSMLPRARALILQILDHNPQMTLNEIQIVVDKRLRDEGLSPVTPSAVLSLSRRDPTHNPPPSLTALGEIRRPHRGLGRKRGPRRKQI